jgi:hypothetical protein
MPHSMVTRVLLVGTLALSALASAGCGGSTPVDPAAAVQQGLKAVDGIPQRGSTIGAFNAPVTLTIFDWVSDLRLADVTQNELLAIIAKDVRNGKLKVQLRTMRFRADPDSDPAARIVQAAGLQGRFWQALVAFLPNYTGVIADDTAQQAFRSAKVPSVAAAFGARQSPQVTKAIDRADTLALSMNVRNAPKYVLVMGNGSTVDVSKDAVNGQLTQAVEKALKG